MQANGERHIQIQFMPFNPLAGPSRHNFHARRFTHTVADSAADYYDAVGKVDD
jgi:hypothetical protein